MRIVSLLFFFLLFYSFNSAAQIPDLPTDTLETVESDSTVIYVIQAEPIIVIEKISVVKPPAQYYLSFNFSVLGYSEFKNAKSTYDDYLTKLNSATNNLPSYFMGISIWKCPRKIYTEYSLSVLRLFQKFDYTYTDSSLNNHIYPESLGTSFKTTNSFNYIYTGLSIGYWAKRNQKISYIPSIGVLVGNLLSYSSYTLNKNDPSKLVSIREEIKYQEFIMDLSLQLRCMIRTKKNMVEISPYVRFSPLSATSSSAPYSVLRSLWGLKIGLTNQLF